MTLARKDYNEIAWEFARKVAAIDKQLLSSLAVETLTELLVTAHITGAEETREAIRAVLPKRLTDDMRGINERDSPTGPALRPDGRRASKV